MRTVTTLEDVYFLQDYLVSSSNPARTVLATSTDKSARTIERDGKYPHLHGHYIFNKGPKETQLKSLTNGVRMIGHSGAPGWLSGLSVQLWLRS